MDSPRIAMNEPPKFGENQVPKRASRSSLDMKSLGRHTRIGRCAWYSIPVPMYHGMVPWHTLYHAVPWDGDGMGAAWQSHKAELGDSSGLFPAVLRFYCFIPDGLGMAQQTPDRLC